MDTKKAAIVGGGLLATAALTVALALGAQAPQGAPEKPAPASVQVEQSVTPTVTPVAPAPVAETSQPIPPAPAPAPAPDPKKCPAGTKAGAVDDSGNESNCQTTKNGQPCVEYNDDNKCVAWYKP